MTKTLEMVFRDAFGKETIIRLADPKDGLTQAEVLTAMETIIAKNIFATKGGDLAQAVEARIRTLDTAAL
ncbi:MAG: DUF2922 domain-containing protein [Negativicutes bacterium]|nr:DUF2922 domain-containing protein [Negativicutes bacterium]